MGLPTSMGRIEDELRDAEIGDWRLRERLMKLGASLDSAPSETLPKATRTEAGREAAYRFLGNRKVTAPGILAPHIGATVDRCRRVGFVYVVSDTTDFSFTGERGEDLGRLYEKQRGFLSHFALAVAGDGSRMPLGILGLENIVREETRKQHRNNHQSKKDPKREALRWGRMVDQVSEELQDVPAVHVMDSEGDMFELLVDLTARGRRFIIRSAQNRLVEEGKLDAALETAPALLEREVNLSRRRPNPNKPPSERKRNQPRQGRIAHLLVSSKRVALRRPKTSSSSYPPTLEVNVVRVYEPSPPDDQEPVEWLLLTSEPITTATDVAAVVDGYRTRWIIEEFFKAIKTGCAYEDRQLESLRGLTNLLAIIAIIAWRLLLLRSLQRTAPATPAERVIDPQLLEALAARLTDIREPKSLPAHPTVTEVFAGIARLGGHIKSNGAPGWQVLWRGYQDLLTWGGGYIRAKSITYSDHS